jgi:hypothetical protein
MLIGTAIDGYDDESAGAEFYKNIQSKMITQINKYSLQNPKLRQKLKLFLKGINNNQVSGIIIKADTTPTEKKYLKELHKPSIKETCAKYLQGVKFVNKK